MQHFLDPAKVDQPAQGLFAGDIEQEVIRFIFLQGVIQDIGAEGRLPARLTGLGGVPFDQPCDGGGGAERAFHHRIAGQPMVQPVMQGCGINERGGVIDRIQPPDQRGIIGGDEAQGVEAQFLHPFCQQQAERLLRVATGEAVEDRLGAALMGEAFDQQSARLRQLADLALQGQPFGRVARQLGPALLGEHALHAGGELGRGGEFGAHERSDAWFFGGRAADLYGHFPQPLVFDDLAADQERVARAERGGETFLDFAQRGTAAAAFHTDLQRVRVLNGTDVHTDTLAAAGVAQVPFAVGAHQSLPPVVGAQGVAACGTEIEAGVKGGAAEAGIGPGRGHLGIERIGVEGAGAGGDQDMLA